jgi:hypothetical protein
MSTPATTVDNIIEIRQANSTNAMSVRLLGIEVFFSFKQPIAFVKTETPATIFYLDTKMPRRSQGHLDDFVSAFLPENRVAVSQQIFGAWLYESLRRSVKSFSF